MVEGVALPVRGPSVADVPFERAECLLYPGGMRNHHDAVKMIRHREHHERRPFTSLGKMTGRCEDGGPGGGIVEVPDFSLPMADSYEEGVAFVHPRRALVGEVFADAEIHPDRVERLNHGSKQERP